MSSCGHITAVTRRRTSYGLLRCSPCHPDGPEQAAARFIGDAVADRLGVSGHCGFRVADRRWKDGNLLAGQSERGHLREFPVPPGPADIRPAAGHRQAAVMFDGPPVNRDPRLA
jgi:hypothetical protein